MKTDLYWIVFIKSHMVVLQRYEYAARLRDIERKLYKKYTNRDLSGNPVPDSDKSLGENRFLLDVIHDVQDIMKNDGVGQISFKEVFGGLIPIARQEKIDIIFSE